MGHLVWVKNFSQTSGDRIFSGHKTVQGFFLFHFSGSSLNGHSRKRKAPLTAAVTKTRLFQLSHNSVFLHSRKRPAPVTDTFFASGGCPLTRASTVPLYASKDFFYFSVEIFFYQVFPCKNCFPPKSVCRIFFTYVSHLHPHPPDRQKSNGQPLTLVRGYTTPVHQ